MDGPGSERPAWFVGDLGDPWVVAIADRLPISFRRRPCVDEMPEAWVAEDPPPGLVVLHRPILTGLDVQRIGRLRARGEPVPRIVLCHGPHVRYDDLVRSARLFDAVLPEATASETIRRHVESTLVKPVHRPPIGIISGLHEVRRVLVDSCRGIGYRAESATDGDDLAPPGVVVWDVPMLDPRWPERMARRSRSANVVALLGFADREAVATARQAGASACLEWPCDLDDLVYVLDRMASLPRIEPGHLSPPPPALGRRGERVEVVGPGRSA